jgi:D-xylose reductase
MNVSTPTLKLNTGDKLPAIGLGFWKIAREDAADTVLAAIRAGYRHFDCACDYGNEAEIGAGIAKAIDQGLCRREDLWVTNKLWNTYHSQNHVRQALDHSLHVMNLEYFDLYLIHFPISLRFVPFHMRYPPGWVFDPVGEHARMEAVHIPIAETWGAMEELAQSGRVKNIGVCNFPVALLRDLRNYAKIRPAVLQVELHPYLAQEKLLRFCAENHIAVTAFSPLGAQSYFSLNMAEQDESVLEQPIIQEVAQCHGKTPAQVVLRWGVQRGTAVIPKTSRPERLAENLAIFNFELAPEEMHAIHSLDKHRRFNDPGVFCEQAFGTFFPIFE